MALTRKEFIKKGCLYCSAGVFCLAGGSILLNACSPLEEPLQEDLEEKPAAWQPAYATMAANGKLADRVEGFYRTLNHCTLCPRQCGVDRSAGERGFCQAPKNAVVYSHQPHFGEELPLVGNNGSGTIFFSNCNLRCVFCQNYPIAHLGWGDQISDEEVADMMLDLQNNGCHNINLVTPTHVLPNIVGATKIAYEKGLDIPLCYNTSGYEEVETIKMLEGIIDIYLPDLKFMDGEKAERYNLAKAYDYPEKAKKAIIEMHKQVGDLVTDERGTAKSGLMIRHLVMPNRVSSPKDFAYWVAENLSKDTYVNIMSQYRVEFEAFEYEEIARAITSEEYVEAMEWAKEAGLNNLDERSLSQLNLHRRKID